MLPAEVTEKLREAIEYEFELKQLPAISIAIVDTTSNSEESLHWSAGFGHRDNDATQKVSNETVYRVGSVSKLFTDLAIMQAVEAGKLDLDAPVTRWLPEFKPSNPSGETISLRRLMSHQAGLVREPPVGHYFDDQEPSLANTVASLRATQCVYTPGTKTKYSNAGIAVVGRVLEIVYDQPFEQIIESNILKPLGMGRSSFALNPELAEQLAHGQMWTHDGRRFAAPEFAFGMTPAANLYSTVDDLAKFAMAILRSGEAGEASLVSSATLEEMTTATKYSNGQPGRFGIGFHVAELDGHLRIGHGGAVYGHATQFELLPTEGLGVIVATSLDGANGVASRLSSYALRLMLAARASQSLPEYEQTAKIPMSRARQLRGLYAVTDADASDGNNRIRIWNYGDRVWLRKGSTIHELRALQDKLVVDDVTGYGLEIQRLADGRLLVGDQTFERLADALPPPAPEEFTGLIGEYGWDYNTLYVFEREGELFALIEWFYFYPLTRVDADAGEGQTDGKHRYAFPDYGLYHGEYIDFECDETGVAQSAIAAGIEFSRREVGTKDGETFRIEPVQPIEKLRELAAQATPPKEPGELKEPDLVDLTQLDPSIKLDIRYATTNNFMSAIFYKEAKALMQRPAAEAVVRVHQKLAQENLGLLIHDAYRPWYVTKMFWDATPAEMKDFVANPANGSRHNRGCAVDLTLFDRTTGEAVETVAGYDEFSNRSFPQYTGGTSRQRWYRRRLREAMESEQFQIYEYEWWHFDFWQWKQYPILNQTFDLVQP